jgi:hypothetical protein
MSKCLFNDQLSKRSFPNDEDKSKDDEGRMCNGDMRSGAQGTKNRLLEKKWIRKGNLKEIVIEKTA